MIFKRLYITSNSNTVASTSFQLPFNCVLRGFSLWLSAAASVAPESAYARISVTPPVTTQVQWIVTLTDGILAEIVVNTQTNVGMQNQCITMDTMILMDAFSSIYLSVNPSTGSALTAACFHFSEGWK